MGQTKIIIISKATPVGPRFYYNQNTSRRPLVRVALAQANASHVPGSSCKPWCSPGGPVNIQLPRHPHSQLQEFQGCHQAAPRLTLYFSFANNTEALWNLHSGFLGSMLIALFKVSKAFSDFFNACWTWHTKREQFQKGKNNSSSARQRQTLLTVFTSNLLLQKSICPVLDQA